MKFCWLPTEASASFVIIIIIIFSQIYDIFLMEWIFSIEIEWFFFLIERNNVNSALTE